jgi:hypothetical protein
MPGWAGVAGNTVSASSSRAAVLACSVSGVGMSASGSKISGSSSPISRPNFYLNPLPLPGQRFQHPLPA